MPAPFVVLPGGRVTPEARRLDEMARRYGTLPSRLPYLTPAGIPESDTAAREWWAYMVDYLCMTAGHHVHAQWRAQNPKAFATITVPAPGT